MVVKLSKKHILDPRKISKKSILKSKEESNEPLTNEEIIDSSPVPLFPQALIISNKSNHSPEIYEVFK